MFFELWIELMILQTIVGYSFALANEFIGLYNIRDLNLMKSDFETVRFHKRFGWIEIFLFYALFIQCMYMLYMHVAAADPLLFIPSGLWAHTWVGGLIASIMVTFKFIVARFKKDSIYLYGKYIGPIGFFGWTLAHWTSLYNFYFVVLPYWNSLGRVATIAPASFTWAAIIPFIGGLGLFVFVLYKRDSEMKEKTDLHGVAMILHGIAFGNEGSAKDLVGTPVLYKYVFPKTYEFLERYSEHIGLNLNDLKNYNLNEAMQKAMRKFEDIGMAEKLKIKWKSENEFTVESVNCSTAVVRSYMKSEELVNSICPWGILAATIVNALTGKNIEISPSEFNEIGAVSRLKIINNK